MSQRRNDFLMKPWYLKTRTLSLVLLFSWWKVTVSLLYSFFPGWIFLSTHFGVAHLKTELKENTPRTVPPKHHQQNPIGTSVERMEAQSLPFNPCTETNRETVAMEQGSGKAGLYSASWCPGVRNRGLLSEIGWSKTYHSNTQEALGEAPLLSPCSRGCCRPHANIRTDLESASPSPSVPQILWGPQSWALLQIQAAPLLCFVSKPCLLTT